MHTLLHLALKIILIVGIASLFAFTVSIRPGSKRPTRRGIIGLLIVGAIIGILFLTTQSLYEVSTAL